MVKDDVRLGKNVKIWHPELVNLYGCSIGDETSIGAFVEIGKGVRIGKNVRIGAHCFIPEGVTIYDDCFIGPGVTFCNDKCPPSYGLSWGKVIVGERVAIGARSVILPGVVIGCDSMIGAGSVVTKNVRPWSLVYGNPAAYHGDAPKFLTRRDAADLQAGTPATMPGGSSYQTEF